MFDQAGHLSGRRLGCLLYPDFCLLLVFQSGHFHPDPVRGGPLPALGTDDPGLEKVKVPWLNS
ncbi:MAG: hypothetical protein R6X07_03980, partial [Desulfatiglandales bacterium]